MNQRRIIPLSDVAAAGIREQGALLDVRNGSCLSELLVSHFRTPLADIEEFMSGTLAGERAREFVSTLIFLSLKWRSVYVLSDIKSEAVTASLHLEKLGFKDATLVVGWPIDIKSGAIAGGRTLFTARQMGMAS